MPRPEHHHPRRERQALDHELAVRRERGRRARRGSAGRQGLEALEGPVRPRDRRRDDPTRLFLRRASLLRSTRVAWVGDQRLDEDVDGAAAGESQVPGEVGVEVVGDQRGPPLRLRFARGPEHVGLHAAAAHGAVQPALTADQHLGAGRDRRGARRPRHRGERAGGAGAHQLGRRTPQVHRARGSFMPET